MSQNRIFFLDGLRAVATIAVLAQHYLEYVAHDTFRPFLSLGPGVFGVVLFFFISGYVIPFSVKNGLVPVNFLTRRVFRIFPLFLCVLFCITVLGLVGIPPYDARLARLDGFDYLANVLLLFEYTGSPAMLGVSWTLSIEFAWYVLFMVYFLAYGHRRVTEASLLFSAGMIALAGVSYLLEARMPFGRLGMLNAALMGYVFCCWHLGESTRARAFTAAGGFVVATVVCQYVGFAAMEHHNITFLSASVSWTTATAVFLVVCSVPALRNTRFWQNAVIGKIGELSFSIYLVHAPVMIVLANVLSGTALFVVALICTYAISELTFRYVEMPGNRLGRNIPRLLKA
ncbi:acyltransferase family protein [Pseudooceanicola sp. C21-150M6]|uniref:acyltransferase family protein n=1 Tax=Pseudooceanicola sp. C21-150M6 TaxID=3434355 RepID=UPI003D7F5846